MPALGPLVAFLTKFNFPHSHQCVPAALRARIGPELWAWAEGTTPSNQFLYRATRTFSLLGVGIGTDQLLLQLRDGSLRGSAKGNVVVGTALAITETTFLLYEYGWSKPLEVKPTFNSAIETLISMMPQDEVTATRGSLYVQELIRLAIKFAELPIEVVATRSSGTGVFTAYLLEGLRGAAAHDGEVTANALFDFIDRKMGSNDQRPMLFGQMTGRVVLVEHDNRHSASLPASQASSAASASVDSTGNWCLLGKSLFEAAKVQRTSDGSFVLEIPSSDSETDAALASMKPGQYGSPRPTMFAHRSDGMLVRVISVESHSVGSEQVWKVGLKPEQNQQAGFGSEMSFATGGKLLTGDDLAKLRAGRLLLNQPPPTDRKKSGFHTDDLFVESFIRGIGNSVSATDCVVQMVYEGVRKTDEAFLRAVRLLAVFMLKTTNVCEHILELKVGPILHGHCHVRFRGRRAVIYQNRDAIEFEIEGDCPLE